MEFDTSVVEGKAPGDGAAMGIALGSKAAMRSRKTCILSTRRDKQPRAKMAISISVMLSQLPCLGV